VGQAGHFIAVRRIGGPIVRGGRVFGMVRPARQISGHDDPVQESFRRQSGDPLDAQPIGKVLLLAELIDLRSLYPLDRESIIESVRKTGRAVVVQEAPRTAGLAAEITSLINEEAFLSLEAPVNRVTGYDTVVPLARLEDEYRPGLKRLEKALEETLNF
jgi:hypothetical protein